MFHSTITRKGQTTIPAGIRTALKLAPGGRVEYALEGDHATLRAHPGTTALKGALASSRGKGLSFARIRAAAAQTALKRKGRR